jgi:signal transduction histidine kinase
VSHEIRTPLNVVVSGLDLLSSCDEKFSVDVLDILRDVKISCAVAIDILNDLLTYEKMDSNILTLDKSACDMVEILRRVYNMFRVQAIHSNIAMELLLEPSTIETVIVDADSTKLSQVFRNLISNAIKFTSGGGKVTIKVSVDPVTRLARVDVQDTGPGISKEDRKKLFNEVVQFNPKELQNGQGSGLGLYLSRKIIDMHGGLIGVDNEWEGIGSKFYIALKVSGNLEENTKGKISSYFYCSHTCM